MRRKLPLQIAVAAFAIVIVLGVDLAGAGTATEASNAGPGVDALTAGKPGLAAECANGVDDDGDSAIDAKDSDCASAVDADESPGTDQVKPDSAEPGAAIAESPDDEGRKDGGSSAIQNAPVGPGAGQAAVEIRSGDGGGEAGAGRSAGEVRQNESIEAAGIRRGPNGQDADDDPSARPPSPPTPTEGPTISNPTTTIAPFGPAPIGVPNFVIDSFEIPPFLLPIYQACGTEYNIPWQVLASINKIETAFGTNLNVSSAGAVGWMQFIPSSWQAYGVDANADGRKDPYNPVDAICAAARYLRAAGGEEDLYNAIFAYNHADWYVDEVLLYARAYGKLPDDLVSSLTGLTEGAHFPVAADARYADDISTREALRRAKPAHRDAYGSAADIVTSSPTRRGINIFSRRGAPIVAVNDGVIKAMGRKHKLGKYIVLQDAYGNRFTYAQLGDIVRVHPVPKPQKLTASDFKLVSPPADDQPASPATDTDAPAPSPAALAAAKPEDEGPAPVRVHVERSAQPVNSEDLRPRLFALPDRPANRDRASLSGQLDDLAGKRLPGYETFKNYFDDVFAFDRRSTELRPLGVGSKVVAGTVLARMAGPVDGIAPHINFSIRPSGRGAPRIDPKPILDGWKLLEATAIYSAAGKNPLLDTLGVGGVLLLSKSALIRRVLSDPRLEIYSCGRTDIRSGQVDRRVLAMLEYLVEKGFRLTITSLRCGHSYLTASGNVSNHSSGNAVDIAMINGIPVTGHQGPGSLTEALVRTVMQLQGTMEPDELISLMDFGPPSFALADHYDHVHVGYTPVYEPGLDQQFVELLKPEQWERLIDRLGEIDNPTVPVGPSDYSLPTKKSTAKKGGDSGGTKAAGRASDAHIGE